MKLNPLTPEQQQLVLKYRDIISARIIARYPLHTDRRDVMLADAMLAICEAVASFPGGTEAELDAFVWKMVHKAHRDAWNEEKRHRHEQIPADMPARDPIPGDDPPIDPAEREEKARAAFDRLFRNLPVDDQIALAMKSCDRSTDDVAAQLNKPVRTVRHRIKQARDAFNKLFSEKTK